MWYFKESQPLTTWLNTRPREPLSPYQAPKLIEEMLHLGFFTETTQGLAFQYPPIYSQNHMGLYDAIAQRLADYLNPHIRCAPQPGQLVFLGYCRIEALSQDLQTLVQDRATQMLAQQMNAAHIDDEVERLGGALNSFRM